MLINCLAACAHLTITVSEIQRDIGRKSSFFSYLPCIRRPVRGVPVGIAPPRLVRKKLEWIGYHMVKKFRRYLYSFWRNSRTWRTDRQTPGDGNSRAMHSIARQKLNAVSVGRLLMLLSYVTLTLQHCARTLDKVFWGRGNSLRILQFGAALCPGPFCPGHYVQGAFHPTLQGLWSPKKVEATPPPPPPEASISSPPLPLPSFPSLPLEVGPLKSS